MNSCAIEHHDNQKVKYICIDPKCSQELKLGCADCFLEDHVTQSAHQRVPIKKFEDDLNAKINNVRNLQIEPISNDTNQFDEDFQICLNQVVQRLNLFKTELKKEVDMEIQNFDEHVSEFRGLINNEIDPILPSQSQSITSFSQQDLAKAISFYQESDQVSQQIQKQFDRIEGHREKVNKKKEKVTQKLQNAVDLMLKQLDEFLIKKPNPDIHCTPEKVTNHQPTILLSASSTTQSPPIKNIIDAARSKKIQLQSQQTPGQPQQKKTFKNKS